MNHKAIVQSDKEILYGLIHMRNLKAEFVYGNSRLVVTGMWGLRSIVKVGGAFLGQ